jgi:uncharacterized DUF497 family protein
MDGYEWDTDKAEINFQKHEVAFADTVAVFEDDNALTIPDDDPDEDRFITLGMDTLGRILIVVYTWRGENIRIISARKATRAERKHYQEG